ncbi:polyphosphate kinase [Niastella yeongjuensis]|uniref:Polyphosphate kinase n=1 Tax=Niastella yeongjuensis TaxID=354355 RepID=A0A1V9ELP7_9BACT|nr:PPK2 family polyphosphate kinase [Niastella yeongjuensis]OQP47067.1 polyphosphate kinase [Niastella yeongjuensis]SEN68159.1 polyphosphate:nucleotide phosphotransferase, PPK2 family [Niastella yeongjuensis]
MANIKLKEISTRAPKDLNKEETKEKLTGILAKLDQLQNLLYAESIHSVLIVLQGMDASGKDGLVRKVFTSMNPQGVRVHSFKVPTSEEASHDFLWRIHAAAPSKGMIQLFNRSQYEDVLVTRVHKMIDDKTARKRMKAINDFEQLLVEHNNTQILKFYLHISPEEQQERLQERIHNPAKQWKYNESDFQEAKLWDDYMAAYEDCFEHCNDVPWTIVPADQNWYKEYVIASALLKTLEKLDMQFPGLKKG